MVNEALCCSEVIYLEWVIFGPACVCFKLSPDVCRCTSLTTNLWNLLIVVRLDYRLNNKPQMYKLNLLLKCALSPPPVLGTRCCRERDVSNIRLLNLKVLVRGGWLWVNTSWWLRLAKVMVVVVAKVCHGCTSQRKCAVGVLIAPFSCHRTYVTMERGCCWTICCFSQKLVFGGSLSSGDDSSTQSAARSLATKPTVSSSLHDTETSHWVYL